MSDDGNHEVGPEWEAVELAGTDITDGDFTVTARTNQDVLLTRRSTAPTPDNAGSYILSGKGSGAKYTLSAAEKLYAKTTGRAVLLGVIET